jgi:hypothetical protein
MDWLDLLLMFNMFMFKLMFNMFMFMLMFNIMLVPSNPLKGCFCFSSHVVIAAAVPSRPMRWTSWTSSLAGGARTAQRPCCTLWPDKRC